jgi:hypothetical protein
MVFGRGSQLSRRLVLQGAGGAAVLAPFLGSLREVRGQEAQAPRRLVIFFTHNGCITDKWWPALEDGPLSADTFAQTTLAVLGPHYKKLLLPRGFRSMNAYGVGQTIDPHDQAMGSKLTCAPIVTDQSHYATAESLDHVIAKQINPQQTPPLVLSVGKASSSIKDVISFSAPSTAWTATVDPYAVYSLLTGVSAPGTNGNSDFRLKRGQSVIDIIHDDLATLQRAKMSQSDQQHIQAWLDLLRATEVGMSDPGMLAACSSAPDRLGISEDAVRAASPKSSDPAQVDLATAFTSGGDMMMNLMALSMICDTNRVLVLTYPGYVVFDWDGIKDTHDHSGLANRTGDFSVGGACLDGVIDQLLQIDGWYASKYGRLVGLLDSVSEGSGTLLDNTATLWLQEFSDGCAQNLNNLPLMIAGSAGGYLKQGYAVNVEGSPIGLGNSSHSCDDPSSINVTGSGSTGGNVPINKLYVTLMNAVGCTADGTPSGGKVSTFGVFDGLGIDSSITNPGEVTALTPAG